MFKTMIFQVIADIHVSTKIRQMVRVSLFMNPEAIIFGSSLRWRTAPVVRYYPSRISRNGVRPSSAWVTEIAEVRLFFAVAHSARLRRRRPFLAPSNSTFQFDIRESRRFSRFRLQPPIGGLSPKIVPKSPRSLKEADPRVTYKGVGVISKSELTTMARRGYLHVRTCMAKDSNVSSFVARMTKKKRIEVAVRSEKGKGRSMWAKCP